MAAATAITSARQGRSVAATAKAIRLAQRTLVRRMRRVIYAKHMPKPTPPAKTINRASAVDMVRGGMWMPVAPDGADGVMESLTVQHRSRAAEKAASLSAMQGNAFYQVVLEAAAKAGAEREATARAEHGGSSRRLGSRDEPLPSLDFPYVATRQRTAMELERISILQELGVIDENGQLVGAGKGDGKGKGKGTGTGAKGTGGGHDGRDSLDGLGIADEGAVPGLEDVPQEERIRARTVRRARLVVEGRRRANANLRDQKMAARASRQRARALRAAEEAHSSRARTSARAARERTQFGHGVKATVSSAGEMSPARHHRPVRPRPQAPSS